MRKDQVKSRLDPALYVFNAGSERLQLVIGLIHQR